MISTLVRAAFITSVMVALAAPVLADQTLSAAIAAYDKAHNFQPLFSTSSGNYGVAVTTTSNGNGGMMEFYHYSATCKCWTVTAHGGGRLTESKDFERVAGVDPTDAVKISTSIKAYFAKEQ